MEIASRRGFSKRELRISIARYSVPWTLNETPFTGMTLGLDRRCTSQEVGSLDHLQHLVQTGPTVISPLAFMEP